MITLNVNNSMMPFVLIKLFKQIIGLRPHQNKFHLFPLQNRIERVKKELLYYRGIKAQVAQIQSAAALELAERIFERYF